MSEAKSQRLFFALWPDDARRQAIAQMAAGTLNVAMDANGRLVPERNLHVTVVFLGQVAADRFADVIAAAQGVTIRPFELQFDRLESWPEAKVLVLAANQVPAGFGALVTALRNRLSSNGFNIDSRAPRPHVTLARKVRAQDLAPLDAAITWKVDEFALVQSETLSGGSEYTVLRRWPFG